MNVEWAIAQLDTFVESTGLVENEDDDGSGFNGVSFRNLGSYEEISAQFLIVERILTRALPDWRQHLPNVHLTRWDQERIAAIHAREMLSREEEIRENLGDDAPRIAASDLHSWIWNGAASLWQSRHFREAVEGAIRKLNAETQNKVNRRDVSEEDLFKQAFSLEAAQPGKSRLRRMPPDDGRTYKNLQRGAMAFAEGIFAGIRNPIAHEADHDLSEQQALEYLAALSVLARWVDEATVARVEETP